jgi:hypothetical protein
LARPLTRLDERTLNQTLSSFDQVATEGLCDDWRSHFDARKARSPGELGAIGGA